MAEVLVNSGFGMAYVQKKNATETDANTVFFVNLIVSLLLFLLLISLAPAIARFYGQPQLLNLIRVMTIVVIINAFIVIQRAQIIKNVSFKKYTKITLSSSLISGLAGIASAYFGLGVWALVIKSISERIIIAAGLWITSEYRPKMIFSKEVIFSIRQEV